MTSEHIPHVRTVASVQRLEEPTFVLHLQVGADVADVAGLQANEVLTLAAVLYAQKVIQTVGLSHPDCSRLPRNDFVGRVHAASSMLRANTFRHRDGNAYACMASMQPGAHPQTRARS